MRVEEKSIAISRGEDYARKLASDKKTPEQAQYLLEDKF
jgi:hypothetical protein